MKSELFTDCRITNRFFTASHGKLVVLNSNFLKTPLKKLLTISLGETHVPTGRLPIYIQLCNCLLRTLLGCLQQSYKVYFSRFFFLQMPQEIMRNQVKEQDCLAYNQHINSGSQLKIYLNTLQLKTVFKRSNQFVV